MKVKRLFLFFRQLGAVNYFLDKCTSDIGLGSFLLSLCKIQ